MAAVVRQPDGHTSRISEPNTSSPDQKPTRRRAPPPSLTSLDKLNPFITASASNRSSPSSSYLSPPVISDLGSSPPPQPIADDYLNARIVLKKRGTSSAKRIHSSLQDSLDSTRAKHGRSATSDSESGDTRSIFGQPDSLLGMKPALDTTELKLKHQQTNTLSAPAATHQTAKGGISGPLVNGSVLDAENATSNVLRKMSQSTNEPSLFGSRHLRRFSQAVVAAVQPSSRRSSVFGDGDSGAAPGLPQIRGVDTETTSLNGGLRRQRTGLQKPSYLGLETPATITLRKASDAYFVVIGQTNTTGGTSTEASITFPPKPAPDPEPSVALMDFRSRRVAEPRKSLWYSLPLLSDQNEKLDNLKDDTSQSQPATNEAIHESLSIFNSMQGPGTAAETAITFTDVYPASQSFASVPYSRRPSSSTMQRLRRTSTVHIKSRTSVHEIIWHEDENSSGSSSRGSASPSQKDTSPKSLGTMTPTTPKATAIAHSAPLTPRGHLRSPALESTPEENLFQWSWNAQQAAAASSARSLNDPPAPASISKSAPVTPPKRLSMSKESGNTRVESFPPLRDRKDTTEWRRAPLVDLNDPLAGQVTRVWIPKVTIEGIHGFNDADDGEAGAGSSYSRQSMDGVDGLEGGRQFRRRSSAHPYTPARLGPRGRIGSSLGASSHRKMGFFVSK